MTFVVRKKKGRRAGLFLDADYEWTGDPAKAREWAAREEAAFAAKHVTGYVESRNP